ncbi:MAG TPA: metalloregulator ArsR/SmtB family transcription factor [Amnibacterium sp.]|jgi:DNA-binding transcriptional ArsR family regulator
MTDELSAVFAALADPTRRAILERLSSGGATVGQLAEPFDMTFAAVSKHLRVLERAGLVRRGRDAQYRPASLDARPLAAAHAWLGGYARFWADSFDALAEHLATIRTTTTTTTAPEEPHHA